VSSLDVPVAYVVGEDTFEGEGVTVTRDVDIDGRLYVSVVRTDGSANKDGFVCVDYGTLVSAGNVATEKIPTWWENLVSFLKGIDYRPLWVSLKTSFVALVIVFVLGLLAAWKSMGVTERWKGVVDTIFTIPMVLPPTVCGFLLLLLFGNATPFGQWLIAHGVKLVFSWPATVIAATVVAFPLMYRTSRGAFEALDGNMLDAARTLGWSETRIFYKLMIPLAWPSIAAGTVLAFARAMGEFGATLFCAGNYAGVTQTMPIAIYFQWMAGNTDVAIFWVIVVIIISFLVILFINLYSAHSQRYRKGGLTRAERRQYRKNGRLAGDDAEAEGTFGGIHAENAEELFSDVSTESQAVREGEGR
jgi:molybdate transport system permease protein